MLEYLEAPENQDVALWPTVLGICCKTFSDVVSSTMMMTAMANTDDMLARLNDVDPANPNALKGPDRTNMEGLLIDILAYAGARKLEYEACNARMLQALKGLTTVAQRWGFYGCISDNDALKFLSGPKNVKSGGWNDVSDRNYYHDLVLFADPGKTITQGQVSTQYDFKPAHHCFALKSTSFDYPGSSHWVDHLWVLSSKDNYSKGALDRVYWWP